MQTIAPPNEIIAAALRACRRHFMAVAAFSALLNLLFLVPMLYMLQIYDRVIPTRGNLTLFFLTLVLLFGLTSLALLDFVRSRLLVRASIRLDRQLAGILLDTSLARRDRTFDAVARQAMREFDMLRQALTGPAIIALVRRALVADLCSRLLPHSSIDRPVGAGRRGGVGDRRPTQRASDQRAAATRQRGGSARLCQPGAGLGRSGKCPRAGHAPGDGPPPPCRARFDDVARRPGRASPPAATSH